MIGRRYVLRILMLAPFAQPRMVRAQGGYVRRIGVLSPGPTLQPKQYRGVWEPLRDLGWREGETCCLNAGGPKASPNASGPLHGNWFSFA